MRKKILFFALFIVASLFSVSINGQQLAFPGAEGFGRYTTGARGVSNPTVYHVTNLNNSGSGSLRDAVSQPGRIVVFDVSGVIKINSLLAISSNIYIAGQTAPGDGVVVYGHRISCSGSSNIIIRHMRFYMGKSGDSSDVLGISNGESMIFDHLSLLWAKDETFSMNWDNKGVNPGKVTMQNSILGQGLIPHSAGGLLRSETGVSVIRSLYISNNTRNPNVRKTIQFVNNVVYNWRTDGWRFGTSGERANAWVEGNYFISGPAGGTTPYAGLDAVHHMYINTANPDYADTNRDGVLNGSAFTNYGSVTKETSISSFTGMTNPYLAWGDEYPILTAPQALENVIANAGATLPTRTDIDDFLIDDLKTYGKGGLNLIAEEKANGIYNNVGLVNNGEKKTDTDNDGIPDEWETAHGLNPNDASDAVKKAANGYLNIENYINSIDGVTVISGQPYLQASYRLRMGSRTPSSITLTWKNRQSDFDNVTLQRSTNGTTFTDVTTLAASATSYTATGLEEETFYTFRIISSKGGNSVISETARISTEGTPGVPLACSAAIHPENGGVSKYYTAVEFTWVNETGPWSYPVSYNVYLGKTAEDLVKVNSNPVVFNEPANEFRFDYRPEMPLDMKGQYYWRVEAVNSHGTAEGPVWNFTASSMSFTENFIDLGRNFTPPSTFTDAQSKVLISNTSSINVTVDGDQVTFTRGGGASYQASGNGIYRKADNKTPEWRLDGAGHYVNIEPSNDQSKEKFISKVTINGTDDKPGESGRNTPVIVFSDRIPFDASRILGYEQVTISKCRGNVAGSDHAEWEPEIMVNAPVGSKSVRVYYNVRLNETASTDGEPEYAIASSGDINLTNGMQSRLTYFGVMLEHISNDGEPVASSINTITEATINGKAATINNSDGTITCKFPFGTVFGEMPVTFKLGDDKATANFESGSTYNFANGSLSIEVTAENGEKKTYAVSATVATKKLVGILTANGKAESYDDLFVSAFADYDVEYITAAATAPSNINDFYSKYDLIVLHSNVGGTNGTGLATKAMVGVKPILNMKVFFYNNGRWDWLTVAPSNLGTAEIGKTANVVPVALQNHPIFDGVTSFSGESLTIYKDAPTAVNSFQFSGTPNGTAWTTQMANANHAIATMDGDPSKINMHELNLDNAAKYLLFGWSYESDSYTKFSDDAITILKNAAAYLMNPDIYYDYTRNAPSGFQAGKVKNLEYINKHLINPNQEEVKIFNYFGMLVLISKNADIDVQNLSSGLYIAKTKNQTLKFIK